MAAQPNSKPTKTHSTAAGCLLAVGLSIAGIGVIAMLGDTKSGGAVATLIGVSIYFLAWFRIRAQRKAADQLAREELAKRLLRVANVHGGKLTAAQAIAVGAVNSREWEMGLRELQAHDLASIERQEDGLEIVTVRGLLPNTPSNSDNAVASVAPLEQPEEHTRSWKRPTLPLPESQATGVHLTKDRRPLEVSPDRFATVAVEPERTITPTISVRVESPTNRFIEAARALHAMEGEHAEHVPFKQYWPTYGSMMPSQLAWYLFWRSRVRQGEFVATDLSYIYLHVYEVLNLVELNDVHAAVSRLDSLAAAYESRHPQLNWRLQDWAGDLLAAKGQLPSAIARWSGGQLVNLGNRGPVGNLVIHNHAVVHREEELPAEWWLELARYHPRNKFYAEFNDGGRIDAGYHRAALAANRHSHAKHGRSIINVLTPPDIVQLKKPLFVSALVDDAYPAEADLGGVRDYFGSMRLSEHLTTVMRYAENHMRRRFGFGRKLSGVEIDPELAALLDAEFIEALVAEKETPIVLDTEKIQKIRRETDSVEALLRPVDDAEASESAPPARVASDAASKPLYSDLVEVRQLWRMISADERAMIRAAFDGQTPPVSAALDRVNDRALPLLGDRLLFVESGVVIIAEDFLDELEIVLKEPEPTSEDASSPVDGIWKRLIGSLNDVETQLLEYAANDGVLDESELASLSKTYRIMPHALLETVNERAFELLGVPLLYADGETWLVEDELLTTLREALSTDTIVQE